MNGYDVIRVLSIHSLLMIHSLSLCLGGFKPTGFSSLKPPANPASSNVVDVSIPHWSPLPQDMHSLFGYQSRNDVLKKKVSLFVETISDT